MMKFLLYGANGYTAQLMLPLVRKYGLTPVLAGRSEEKIRPLAREHGWEFRIFQLESAEQLAEEIKGFQAVLHCAGPYIHSAPPMMKACLLAGTHYLDITGEIPVFELAASLNEEAVQRGITLLPGAGFDVVPTDCLALFLKNMLPDARMLTLAFMQSGGGLSHGTALTALEHLGYGGAIRRNGQIVRVPMGHRAMTVDFGETERFCMAIPWGDVASAWYTTGIPNIEVFTSIHPKLYRWVQRRAIFNFVAGSDLIKNLIRQRIEMRNPGPEETYRAAARSYIWGEVENKAGHTRQARMETPDGYSFTAHSALLLVKKLLQGQGRPGFQTPAGLFGPDLALEIDGVRRW